MLGNLFASFRRPAAQSPSAPPVHAGTRPTSPPIYPPPDAGLPLVDVGELISQQSEILRRIKLAYGVEQSQFDSELTPIVERFARYVHLLPATPANYFRSAAGLLRMSLDVAFYSVQAVDSTLFQGLKSISQRQHLEPRWRLATFIAGLCAELHRALGPVVVTNDRGLEWPPYLGPLYDWAHAQSAERYHLRWVENQQELRATGLFALQHIVSASTLQYLAEGNSLVVPHMLASITGTPIYRGTSNVLDSLVRRAVALVVDTELRSNAEFYGQHRLGAHLERYLVDALRRLVAAGDWTVNGQSSPLWHGADGLFLAWPRAAEEVVRLLERDQLTGIPKSPETILELLVSARVLSAEPGANGAVVQIRPPGASQPINAVRLASESLLTSAAPAPVTPIAGPLMVSPRAAPSPGPAEIPAAPAPAQQEPAIQSPPATATPRAPVAPPFDEVRRPQAVPAALGLRPAARLKPIVHAAVSEILANLSCGAGEPEAELTSEALFVALRAFQKRGIDTAAAVDSLDAAGLLHRTSPSAKTCRHPLAGEPVVGVLVKGSHITGFPARPEHPA
jgi:conjugal transfer pilus assembly protein TraI